MQVATIKELLEQSVASFSKRIAFQIKDGFDYRKLTYTDVDRLIKKVQAQLTSLGVAKGDRVALISENRPEWPIAYLAVTSLGAIVVPLDAMLNKEDILPLINNAGVKAGIVSQKYIGYITATDIENQKIVMEDFGQLPELGTTEQAEVYASDVASIVYTSGTTGVPKGIVLTHKNIVSNVVSVASLFDFGPKDNFLSVLPLHHAFETTAGFLAPFSLGCKITYAESLKSYAILNNMQKSSVTVMCGVPLLYQLFYDGIMREVEEKKLGKLFSLLFFLSKFVKHVIGLNIGKVLFKIIHKKFGGKIRFFVSGGAALDPELALNFDLMGFKILQGYGMTESAPILTCNTLKHNKIGSVGRAIPEVKIKIAGTDPVGEILAFGPNIMKGYYKQKELSSRILINGWLYTGDVGYLDEEGYLFITGRTKDVIVTASGVNVYPDEIEFALNKLEAVKESCVFGDKVKEGIRRGTEEVIALIVPDTEYFEKIGRTGDESIRNEIDKEVKELNKRMADFKRIAGFIVRKEELPKTRLKKIKRFELKKELGVK